VTQCLTLHKIAFEVYDGNKGMPEPGTPGPTGAFLSCMGEKVNTFRPIDGRQWNSSLNAGSNSPALSGSPIVTTPVSASGAEYFGASSVDSAPASPSPTSTEFLSNDGGRVKKQKRSTSSGGVIPKSAGPKGVVGLTRQALRLLVDAVRLTTLERRPALCGRSI
jgi:recombining binding protein (suppressor of hairless)